MKLVHDIHASRDTSKHPVISFEFYPPKSDEDLQILMDKTLPALTKLKPDFCSVTYGAGGSTRDKTLLITDRIQREHNLTAVHHLTCDNSTQAEINSILDQAQRSGIQNILALRGDPPAGTSEFKKTEGGFEFSKELVAFIHAKGGFSIGVAGFPEGHIACKEGKVVDWDRLKQKIDAGADYVITQLFFDNADYYEFHNYLAGKLNVKIPICPGIIPILSAQQIKRITRLCGARLPAILLSRLDALEGDDKAVAAFGIEYATRQCEELLKFGVPALHFYTMNKVHSVQEIVTRLGLK